MTSSNKATAEKKEEANRIAMFDGFMNQFSSPSAFGSELYHLHSLDASAEATRLLADCIEANWIIFDKQGSNDLSLEKLAGPSTEVLNQQQQQQPQPQENGDDANNNNNQQQQQQQQKQRKHKKKK